MANIGKNIKQFRIKKNLTQDQLAEQLFVSRQTISNYENNKSNPDIDMLVKIAEILGTDVNTLIYGQPETAIRKKRVIHEIIIGSILLLMGIAVIKGNDFFELIRIQYFTLNPLIDYTLLVKIPYLFAVGWYSVELFMFFFKVQPINPSITKIIRRVILIVIALYLAIAIPYLIREVLYWITYAVQGHDYANNRYGSYGLGMTTLFYLVSYDWYLLAVIPGMMWSIGCLGKRKNSEQSSNQNNKPNTQ